MHTPLAAAAAKCHAGSLLQQFTCGWNQPQTGAAHAGHIAGHSVLPWLLILAVAVLSVRLAKKRRNAAGAAPARTAARR